MQFSDNGFRPGWNVQFATDVESGILVGLEVTNAGNDSEREAGKDPHAPKKGDSDACAAATGPPTG